VNDGLNRLLTFRMRPLELAQAAALAAINWLASVGCLVAAILAVGARVPWSNVLLIYWVGAAASSFNLTPGGLGVVEAVLTGGLVAAGLTPAVAFGSVLIFRLFSLWLAMLLGWTTYAVIQRIEPDVGSA
jgi:putative heme transporter